MLTLKNEGTRARITGTRPEMIFAAFIVNQIHIIYGYDAIITSGTEGSEFRKKGSDHLVGNALDFRTRHLTERDQLVIADKIQKALGPDFIVILESDHLHVGFKPEPEFQKNS